MDRIGAGRLYFDAAGARAASVQNDATAKLGIEQTNGSKKTTDAVEISANATLLKKAREAVSAEPTVRQDVVEQYRQQIQNGSYRIDSQDLARRIVDVIA